VLHSVRTVRAAGYNLQDGDTLHFGHGLSSASLLFQVLPENFDTLHPVARGLADIDTQSVTPHPLTATLFIKELTSSLWAEIPRRAKVATLGLLALFAAIFNEYRTESEFRVVPVTVRPGFANVLKPKL
jgi:hypothetical protein